MAKDRNANGASKEELTLASYGEMLTLLTRHYERTGDLALKDVIDRARKNISQR